MQKLKYFTLNFGPQHPAAHGVLRLILSMQGEVIKKADPHIGLLHRGTEKLLEYKTYLQGISYFARLDYVSTMSQEHVYCLIVETLLDLEINKKASYIRILFLELTRILNHLLAITTHALDVGAMTPFLWMFEEREKIMEFYERVSGARMHTTFFRFGGISNDVDLNLLNDIKKFIKNFLFRLDDLETLLINSRLWKERLVNIGFVSKKNALFYSFSGPLLRASGVNWDLRKLLLYENYKNFDFRIPVGFFGDCYDRFLIRLEEMRESCNIVEQSLIFLEIDGFILNDNFLVNLEDYKIQSPPKNLIKNSMENLISHFKLYSEGFTLEEEEIYVCVEAPKGEFGVFLESDSTNKPWRCKIRAPGFFHLQGLNFMSYNHLLADVVTIIGTQDIVFGEIDR
jgi:NADH dehydrogenase I D subunit